MSKVYDALMKSGKFTAAQNKAEQGEYVDSIAELVAVCERDGFIPRYYVDSPKDKVDRVLADLQGYTRSLVMEELNLGNMIEQALKQLEIDRKKENEELEDLDDDEALEKELFESQTDTTLKDEDYSEFAEFEDMLEELDDEFFEEMFKPKRKK